MFFLKLWYANEERIKYFKLNKLQNMEITLTFTNITYVKQILDEAPINIIKTFIMTYFVKFLVIKRDPWSGNTQKVFFKN